MKALWDEAFLKQRERNLRDDALAVQTDDDWDSAVMQHERETSDIVGGFLDCPLSRCRRAVRCAGNPLMCMPRCRLELQPGVAQELVEEIYAEIQQERRDAAAEDRAPCVERVVKRRVEDDAFEDEPPATPPEGELERNLRIAREALREDIAPSPPRVQPPPTPAPIERAPDVAAAPPPPLLPLRPAAPPPPTAAVPPPPRVAAAPAPAEAPAPAVPEWKISPEAEERINSIWADHLAGKDVRRRPEPRIRLLSDEHEWGVPPWWRGRR
jgi:hypothetical protein